MLLLSHGSTSTTNGFCRENFNASDLHRMISDLKSTFQKKRKTSAKRNYSQNLDIIKVNNVKSNV